MSEDLPVPAADPAASPDRRLRRRRALRRAGTAVCGVALLGAVAGVAVGSERVPPPGAASVAPLTVDVPAGPVARFCPGPPTLATAAAGEDLDYDEFDPEGAGTQSTIDVLTLDRPAADAAAAVLIGPDGAVDLAGSGPARVLRVAEATGPGVLVAEPAADQAALPAGVAASRTDAGDLRGLVAVPCLAPATTSWLVGGSTEPGSSAQLVLTNLGQTAATVTVTAWGSTGPLETSAGASVLVPPQVREVVLLEAVAGADPRLAVRVEADGGQVSAFVQDTQLRGLVPAGVTAVTPSAEPALDVHVPGVELVESELADPDPAVVRILNPGTEEATLSVSLLGSAGEVPVPGAEDLVVDPGTVVDVSLAGMPAGLWTAALASDQPVVAGALLTRVGMPGEDDPTTPPLDRAWAPGAVLTTRGVVVVPDVAEGAGLVLANASEDTASVTLRPVEADGARGDDVAVSIPGRSSVTSDVADLGEDVLAVEVVGAVHAAAVLHAEADDGALVAVLPLSEDPHSATTVALDRRATALH